MSALIKNKILATTLVSLICLTSIGLCQDKKPTYLNPGQPIAARVRDLISRMTLIEKISQLGSIELAIPNLGIHSYTFGTECLHGIVPTDPRVPTTVFPQAIGMASTWDPGLIYTEASAISDEGRALANRYDNKRYLTFFAPVINMARDPRWGRVQETYGEDPCLTSRVGVAFVKGLQGNDPKYLKVAATLKHFAVYSDEWGRHWSSANVGDDVLREYYLPQFKACVTDANAQSVMVAFNAINGVPCTADKKLLTGILRHEWGFDGYVISDAGGVRNLYDTHRYVASPEEAAAVALKAGVDVDLRGSTYQGYLLKAVKEGLVSVKAIDRALARVLTVKFRLGMFDPPEMVPYAKIPYSVVNSKAHKELALQTALESIVLLKNENHLLPISNHLKSIAVIGPNSAVCQFGTYSGISADSITPLQGIKNQVSPGTRVLYAKGCGIWSTIQSKYLTPAGGKQGQHGWKGEYFGNKFLSGKPVLVRIDKQINFNWRWGTPAGNIHRNDYSARWTATLIPPVSRTYQFQMNTDDGGRLYIANKLLIEEWHDQSPHTYTASIKLKAGQPYDIKMEYFQDNDNACAHLGWDYEPSIEQAAKVASQADLAILFVGEDRSVQEESHDRSRLRLPGVQENLIKSVYRANPRTVVVLINGAPLSIDWTKANVPGIIEAWYPGEEGGKAIADVIFGDYNPSGKLPITFYKSVAQLPPFYNYDIRKGRTYMYLSGKPLFPFGYGLSYTKFKYSNLEISPKVISSTGKVYVKVDVQDAGNRAGDDVVELYVHDTTPGLNRPVEELEGFQRVNLHPGERKRIEIVLTASQLAFYHGSLKRWEVKPGKFNVMIGNSSADIRLTDSFEVTK